MSAADVSTIFLNQTRERFRDDVLLRHLRKRRWFGAKSEALRNASFSLLAPWNSAQGTWTLAIVDVDPEEGGRQRYFQPLAIEWETREIDPLEKLGAWAIAKVRHRDRVGLLHDAFGDPEFSRALARSMGTPGDVPLGPGRLRFSNTPLYASLAAAIDDEVRVPALEQSNTGVFFGNRLFLKAYRHLRLGINPEVEVGRFLTEASAFPHIAPIAGVVEYVEEGAEPVALGLLQKFVENQGDLWTQTLEHLRRILAVPGAASVAEQRGPEAAAAQAQSSRLELLGRRVAEMHRAFARVTGDPAFDPEPLSSVDAQAWKRAVEDEAERTFAAAAAARATIPEALRPQVDELAWLRERLLARVRGCDLDLSGLVKTRYHGDLHLGQVLVAQDDFVIVDFEGEPARGLDERRKKSCVLRDVAGIVRSIAYAADAAELRREPRAGPSNERTQQLLGGWERDAVRDFLAGYRKAAAGIASVPSGDGAFAAILELFLLEKALYELRYEIGNRPDWIPIPLRGLLELARK